MPSIKNLRHGRIVLRSGDTTPLVKYVEFSEGNFQWTENLPKNIVRDRGKIRELTRGDEQPVTWSFSFWLIDKTLIRTIRDFVWDAQAETIGGLTAGALNDPVVTSYDYEQDSLQFASGETGQKLANGATPAVDNDFAEKIGVEDVEGVVVVPKESGFAVFQPAADVDRSVVYDAVGESTLQAGAGNCSGSVKTFNLRLEICDPCNPFDPADPTVGTLQEYIELDNSYLETDGGQEGDEANVITVSGASLTPKGKASWVTV